MSIASGKVGILLEATDKASKTINKVKTSMVLMSQTLSQLGGGFASVGNIMQGFAAGGGLGAVTAGIGEVIKAIQQVTITMTEFETALVDVSSASGLTGDALVKLTDDLTDAAMTAGQEFGVGATAAMQALESLIKAGLEGADAIDALDAALALATVESISTAEASDLLIGVLGMYKLAAEDAAHATDVLVNASIMGIGTASQFARGLAYVGGRAEALGFSLEETTAALVAMNNQGINATSAGQYLNQMFTALITKSDELGFSLYDAQGGMLTLAEISGNLVDKLNSFATAEERNAYLTKIFGARAGIAANALAGLGDTGDEVTQALLDLTLSMDDAGTAMDIVDAKGDTLAGTQARLAAIFENMQLTIGEGLMPVMKWLADIMERYIIPLMEELLPPIVAVIGAVFELAKFLFNLGKIISDFLKPIIEGLIDFFKPVIDVIMAVANAIGWLVGQVVDGVAEIADSIDEAANDIDDSMTGITDSYDEMVDGARDAGREFRDDFLNNRDVIIDASGEIADEIADDFDDISDTLDTLVDDVAVGWNELIQNTNDQIRDGLLGDAQDSIHDFVDCVTNKQAQMVEEIDEYLEDMAAEYMSNVDKIADLQARGLDAEAALLIAQNEEIKEKMRQLMEWRAQLLEEALANIPTGPGTIFDPSAILPPITVPPATPPRGRIPDPVVGNVNANITLEFTEPISPIDARVHAEMIYEEIRNLQEEAGRQKWQ